MILALCLLSVSVAGLAITAMILHHDRNEWKWYHDFWKDSYNNCANDSALLRNEVSELHKKNEELKAEFSNFVATMRWAAHDARERFFDLTKDSNDHNQKTSDTHTASTGF